MYELEGIPYRNIIKEFNLDQRMFFRWVEKYRDQERGKAKGFNKGRPRKKPLVSVDGEYAAHVQLQPGTYTLFCMWKKGRSISNRKASLL